MLKSALGFEQLQQQVRQLLVSLRSEISSGEADLRRLKEEETKLSALAGQRESTAARMRGRAAGAVTRINWTSVLEQLPQQFNASDIRAVHGVERKRSSEIFAAIARWTEAGLVKRKKRGLYDRVQPSRPRKSKKTA